MDYAAGILCIHERHGSSASSFDIHLKIVIPQKLFPMVDCVPRCLKRTGKASAALREDGQAGGCIPAEFVGRPYYGVKAGTVDYLSPRLAQTNLMWSHHFIDDNGMAVMHVFNSRGQPVMRCVERPFDPGLAFEFGRPPPASK